MLYFPYITSLYAGLLGIFYLLLSSYVVMGRWQHKISLQDSGNPDMLRRIRMHANFAEYVPFLLLLMFLLEIKGLQVWALHSFGLTLLIARLVHPIGIASEKAPNLFRMLGAILTYALLGIGSLGAMSLYFWR
jgi:uncharacterized membrane protein YecN with MAPEG domain